MAKCTLTKRNKEAIKMSQSSFPIKGWMGVHVPWLIAAPILLSFIKGAASQCDPMNRPLTLRVVNEYTNILSTDYLNLPSRNINCQWKITANEGDRIALTVINIDLTSYMCANQSIQIFDGETEYNRSLGIFCGRQRGQTLFSSARFMLIKFLSSGSLPTGRFNLNYTRQPADPACRTGTRPTRLTGSTSYFTDLRFPSSGTYYSNNALCDWLVSVPNGYVVQLRVNSINMDASSDCFRDRMDIYDGSSDFYSLARICRNYSQTVNSSGPNMLIRFTSDTLVTRTVFNVSYKAVLTSTTVDSACMTGTRPTRLTGSTSYFTDLHFPRSSINYSNNAICDWLISVPNGYVVQLRVNSVNMETSSDCTWDRMDIYDGSTISDPLLARICSNYFLIVNSSATDMLVYFASDSSFTGTGFSVSYKAVLKSSVTTIDSACVTLTRPARLTGSTSYFMDLHFPRTGNYYHNNALCDWLISVRNGYVVQLRVNFVGMDTDTFCSKDRMDIYDGSTVSSPLLARICRNNFQIVNSTASDMLIRFTSDNSVTGSGFSVSYKAVLNSSVTTIDSACRSGTRPTYLTGSIYFFTDLRFPSSGINYSNNAYCDWLISVPNGYVVQLRVNSVNMEAVSGCTRDRMDIYDGSTVYSLSLARICRYYYYQTVYSTGTNMLIHFTSDSSITGTGFSISYKAVLKSSVTTTTAYTYHGGYSDYSSPSILAISIGVSVAFLALVVLGVIIHQCTRKSSRSPARRSNMAVATRDNVSSRNQRTQTAPQERHDVYTLPTAFPTTAAPFFTNCGYSTFGDQPPTTFPPRNLLAGGNQNPPSNFTGIGPPEYSHAPPSYSEVVNGCYTHDS